MTILTSRVGIITFIIFFLNIYVSSADFNPRKIYDDTSPTVVLITGFEPGQRIMSKGTGSIIRNDGLVLTNTHVILNKKTDLPFQNLRIYLKPNQITGNLKKDTSLKYFGEVIQFSEKLDLALIRIKSLSNHDPLKALRFSDSDSVSIGDPVIAIGHPEQGGLWTLTTGTISSHINDHGNITGKNVFQTETSFNRGNSGGPLIDKNGLMIGVNSMISRKAKDGLAITGVNFSIKSRVVLGWLDSVGFNFKYISNNTRIENSQNAGIVPVPKPKKSKTKPQKRINNIKEEPKILTEIRPYKDKDLIKQVEDEMEDMINEMKTNSKQ
mgnify:FL=1